MIEYTLSWEKSPNSYSMDIPGNHVSAYRYLVTTVKRVLDEGYTVTECKEKYYYSNSQGYTEHDIIDKVIHDFIIL